MQHYKNNSITNDFSETDIECDLPSESQIHIKNVIFLFNFKLYSLNINASSSLFSSKKHYFSNENNELNSLIIKLKTLPIEKRCFFFNKKIRFEKEKNIIELYVNNPLTYENKYILNLEWAFKYTEMLEKKFEKDMDPINNWELIDWKTNEIKPNMEENVNFLSIGEKTWKFVQKMYGGGPEMRKDDYFSEEEEAGIERKLKLYCLPKVNMISFLNKKIENENKMGIGIKDITIEKSSANSEKDENQIETESTKKEENFAENQPSINILNLQQEEQEEKVCEDLKKNSSNNLIVVIPFENLPTNNYTSPTPDFSPQNNQSNNMHSPSLGDCIPVTDKQDKRGRRGNSFSNSTIDSFTNKTHSSRHTDFSLNDIGLANRYLDCYLNASLQLLFCIEKLNEFYILKKHKQIENNYKCKIFSEAYSEILKKCINKSDKKNKKLNKSLTVSSLKELVRRRFDPELQHDAHEFLRFFLSELQDEGNPIKVEHFISTGYWEKDKKQNVSIVDEIFSGGIINTYKCLKCKKEAEVPEIFLDLSLPVAMVKENKRVTLEDCLNSFFSKENLKNEYFCEFCKKKCNAEKKVKLCKNPKFLVIHLKRFKFFPKKGKICSPVAIPFDFLDIKRYFYFYNI